MMPWRRRGSWYSWIRRHLSSVVLLLLSSNVNTLQHIDGSVLKGSEKEHFNGVLMLVKLFIAKLKDENASSLLFSLSRDRMTLNWMFAFFSSNFQFIYYYVERALCSLHWHADRWKIERWKKGTRLNSWQSSLWLFQKEEINMESKSIITGKRVTLQLFSHMRDMIE